MDRTGTEDAEGDDIAPGDDIASGGVPWPGKARDTAGGVDSSTDAKQVRGTWNPGQTPLRRSVPSLTHLLGVYV